MKAMFLYMLRRYCLAIFFWGLGLALIGVMVVLVYDSIADKQRTLERIVSGMPVLMKALAGDVSQFVTPVGWLHVKYFAMVPLSFGVFAVLTGSGLISNDEETGRLDLFMAYPLSRTEMLVARSLALLTATWLILMVAWFGMMVALPFSKIGVSWWRLGLPFVSLFVVTAFFQAFALVLSFLLPSRLIAAGAAGTILVISFFLEIFLHVQPDLVAVARFFPLRYYQGGMMAESVSWFSLLVLLTGVTVFGFFAWRLFLAREIRVQGQGRND